MNILSTHDLTKIYGNGDNAVQHYPTFRLILKKVHLFLLLEVQEVANQRFLIC